MKELVRTVTSLTARLGREIKVMEVCGTHTMVSFRTGLRRLLPDGLTLISGPGCPVCVTDAGYVDAAIGLSSRPDVTVTTFGDLVKVPGSDSSLERERARGADVRVVYSPTDAVAFARAHRDRSVVFLGVGFETTAPAVAWSIRQAQREHLTNYSVLCAHKTMPRAMEALVKDHEVRVDGFMCPGHVSVITGSRIYRFLAKDYGIPCVVSGFEAYDMLKTMAMLLQQMVDGRATVEVEYGRAVSERGNPLAQDLIDEVFQETDAAWRGLGVIPGSGLAIRDVFAAHDAERIFEITFPAARVNEACRCGDVLRGLIAPPACRLFRRSCTPLDPHGPCMVSTEGVCAAYYRYGSERFDGQSGSGA